MRQRRNLLGMKLGRLSVIRPAANNEFNHTTWLCQCDCGVVKTVETNKLCSGTTTSCGCYGKEARIRGCTKHGVSGRNGKPEAPEYASWRAMINRCCQPGSSRYRRYGGRGITVHPEWRHSYLAFVRDMGPKPEPKHAYSLDRIDNNGPYSPGNCRWATMGQQQNNRITNHRMTHNGQSRTLTEWALVAGIPRGAFKRRIYMGWSIADAVSLPLRASRQEHRTQHQHS